MKASLLSATQEFRDTLFIVLLSAFPFTSLAQLRERVTEICEVVHPLGWVKFKEGINIAGDRVFVDYADNFGLGASDEMRLIRQWTDDLGFTHYRYQQYHAGVPIEYAMFTIVTRNGRSVSGNGRIAAFFSPYPRVAVTKQQALQTAVASLPYGTPSWLDHHNEELSRRVLNVSEFTSYPESQLMFVRRDVEAGYSGENLVLAYKIPISTIRPAAHFEVCIGATNLELVRMIRSTTGCTGETATGATLYNGQQDIMVTESGGEYLLEANCHGTTIRTVKVEANDNSFNTATHQNVVLADLGWPDTDEYKRYAQAQWSAQVTHEYFRTTYQHNSYNNANALMLQVVGGNQATNWYQSAGMLVVRDLSREDPEEVTNWPVSLDVVGHEWTHALTCHATELGVATPSSEFGALYESFGDIFGSLIECYGKETYDDDNVNDCEDYVMFEDFATVGNRRNMIAPNEHEHPDTYCGTYWAENINNFHARGGVHNKWFTLLAKQHIVNNQHVNWTDTNNHCCKPESYSVSPIGRTKAAALAFRNLTTKVKPHFNYVDAMLGSLACADELITAGKMTSADKEQVVEAWKAVGVYENKVGYTFRRCRTYESNADETDLEAINEIRAGSCGSVGTVVMPSATLTYTAGNLVLLRGEFVAESGCTFTARIAEPCTTFFAKSVPSRETHPTRSTPNSEAYNRAISAPTLFTAPNPLNGSGSVWFSVSRPSVVRLSVFDNVGRQVLTIVEGETFVAGSYQRSVATSGLSSGTYICRLVTDEQTVSTIFMVSR